MIKCPNCGSTAQVRMTNIWKDEISIYINYSCGCGHSFVTKETCEKDEEK